MKAKLKKQELNPLLNPVDYFNLYGSFVSIFENVKTAKVISETEVLMLLPIMGKNIDVNKTTFILKKNNMVDVLQDNEYNIDAGTEITKFMLLTAVVYRGDYHMAISNIYFKMMNGKIPYIRVGTDYYKVIRKLNRYDVENIQLKPWKKDEIKQDHGKNLLSLIYKFDDFTIVPNNTDHSPIINNCYNLYSPFAYKPVDNEVYHEDIPVTMGLILHIFGDQWELGLKYMKLLYEYPKQILPVLALVSTERETGKTTFLNWIQMLFGENATLINPSDLMSSFNDGYATKNIIMIDETVIDKMHTIEKLKSIATAKTISVSQKFVSHYSVPFFGKVILCTNKETDFMRIDEEEIRFWVRKINPIKEPKNTKIEQDLYNEIPMFLKYLQMMPEIDFSKSRMVFTQDEIATEQLGSVKEESKSGLRKEIEYLISDYFLNNPNIKELELTPKDIKKEWFLHNQNITNAYIKKVLREEMKLDYSNKPIRYRGFADNPLDSKIGRVYKFINNESVTKMDDECPF